MLVIRESRRTCRSGRKLELQTPAEAPRAVGPAVLGSPAPDLCPSREAGEASGPSLPAPAPGGADPRDSGAGERRQRRGARSRRGSKGAGSAPRRRVGGGGEETGRKRTGGVGRGAGGARRSAVEMRAPLFLQT